MRKAKTEIEVSAFKDSDLSSLVELYNSFAIEIPFSWAVTDEEFAAGALCGVMDSRVPFEAEEIHVARERGVIKGHVHLARLVESDPTGPVGLIRFLMFPEENRSVGEALLNEATLTLARSGCTSVEAWKIRCGYPFYVAKHGGCWEQSYIANLFLSFGFEVFYRVLMFHRNLDFSFGPSRPPDGMQIEKTQEKLDHDLVHIYELRNGDDVLARTSWNRMTAWSWNDAALDYGYVYEVSTAEAHRRKGFGKILMQEMVADMHDAGLVEASLHPPFHNIPAIGLYTKSRFRYIGTHVAFRKQI